MLTNTQAQEFSRRMLYYFTNRNNYVEGQDYILSNNGFWMLNTDEVLTDVVAGRPFGPDTPAEIVIPIVNVNHPVDWIECNIDYETQEIFLEMDLPEGLDLSANVLKIEAKSGNVIFNDKTFTLPENVTLDIGDRKAGSPQLDLVNRTLSIVLPVSAKEPQEEAYNSGVTDSIFNW